MKFIKYLSHPVAIATALTFCGAQLSSATVKACSMDKELLTMTFEGRTAPGENVDIIPLRFTYPISSESMIPVNNTSPQFAALFKLTSHDRTFDFLLQANLWQTLENLVRIYDTVTAQGYPYAAPSSGSSGYHLPFSRSEIDLPAPVVRTKDGRYEILPFYEDGELYAFTLCTPIHQARAPQCETRFRRHGLTATMSFPRDELPNLFFYLADAETFIDCGLSAAASGSLQ